MTPLTVPSVSGCGVNSPPLFFSLSFIFVFLYVFCVVFVFRANVAEIG